MPVHCGGPHCPEDHTSCRKAQKFITEVDKTFCDQQVSYKSKNCSENYNEGNYKCWKIY